MRESNREAAVIPFSQKPVETLPVSLGQLEHREGGYSAKIIKINQANQDPFSELDRLVPEIFKSDVMNTLAMIANDINYETAKLTATKVADFIRTAKSKNKRTPTGAEIEHFINYE